MISDLNDNLPLNLFQTIFEKSPGSLVLKADPPYFTILAASDSYLEITSVAREEVLGRSFFEVFPDNNDGCPPDQNSARTIFTRVAAMGEKIDIPLYRYDVYDKTSNEYKQRFWSCSNVPIKNEEDKVAYILNTVIDITGEVVAKEAAIENESRLRIATEATGLATWDLDLKRYDFVCSPRLAEIFGHPPEASLKLTGIREQVTADDMQNIVVKHYQEALKNGGFAYEVRIYWPDQSIHWINTRGKVLYDDDGIPERILGTVIDITESKRDEIRKNDFIAMASHELKTPLTSLKAYIQILTSKVNKSEDHLIYNMLVKAGNQVNKMTSLIHGFLDLSKFEPGKLQIKPQAFDIVQLIRETIADFAQSTTTHAVSFGNDTPLKIYADREKISQVISNLLSNAVKYSPKGSNIIVGCKNAGDNLQISVRDEGIGIKPRDQEKLFQRFYRVENDIMKNISGFGIGLYLASEIIQRHKGKIWVDSIYGEGSTFHFTLPLKV